MSSTSGRILRPFIALITAGMFLLPGSAVADELTTAPESLEQSQQATLESPVVTESALQSHTLESPASTSETPSVEPKTEPEPEPAPETEPESPAAVESSETSTPDATQPAPSVETNDDDSTRATQEDSQDEELVQEKELGQEEDLTVTPFALGPDGGTPPYVYWNVVDEDGNKVPGATFELERRGSIFWGSNTSVTDGFGTTNSTYDLDRDAGEFLAKRLSSISPNISSGDRLRLRPDTAPLGYQWVSSQDWVDSADKSWVGSSPNQRTLDFGNFVVRQNPTALTCQAGYVYGVSANGQIQQVTDSGTLTEIGGAASGTSSFNGLGISADGQTAYGYERTNNNSELTIYRYDAATGLWTNTSATVNSNNPNRTVGFVAGAVSIQSGRYYVGGFNSTGTRYRIWEYTSGNTSTVYKGEINTSSGSGGANNGDMAFDSLGNLFVVRGSGTTTTVFSVTAADLAAANGGTINSAQAASVTTMNNVNGVAFDASGKAYLGSSGIIRSYDMPNWSNSTDVITSGLSSTDLATCSSPPTITIEKEVLGGRNAPTDQFELTLYQGSTLLDDTVTTGDETGIQSERLGPLPTVRGVELTFAEHAAGTTNLDHYASAYQCELTFQDGTVETLDQVESTSGSIVIPANGEAVTCTFRNAPLRAHVNITKEVTDAAGENAQPRQNWTVGATMSPAAGSSVVSVPNQPTQQTAANGQAAWDFNFGSQDDSATLTVLEDMQDGYTFASGQCVVTSIEGAQEEHEITSPDETTLEGIVPGDRVDCTYTNKPAPSMLTVQKNIVGLAKDGDNFTISAHTGDNTEPAQQLGESATTAQSGRDNGLGLQQEIVGPVELVNHSADDVFWIREQAADGADLAHYHSTFECVDATPDSAWEAVSGELVIAGDYKQASIGTIPVAANGQYADIECTIFNTPNPQLTLVKLVDNPETGEGYALPTDWNLSATEQGNTDPVVEGITGSDDVTSQFVPAGTYTLDEAFRTTPNKSAGYQWTGLVCQDDEDAEFSGVSVTQDGEVVTGAAVALELQDDVTCTFTNTPILGSVTWTKVGEDGEPLGGSTWNLTGPGPDGETVEVTTENEPGEFLVEDLYWGDYTVSELRAPAGYVLDATEHEFTVNYATLAHEFDDAFVNAMREGPALPLTGGLGRDFFFAAGIGIAVIGLGTVGAMNLRNRRKGAA